MSDYILLTGATGLLGRYLMRDLLQAGNSVAVLVRPKRRQTAEQRIDAILATWEESLQRPLPRPVVLEGDICQPHLGLDHWGMRWVTENCDAFLHNAASLTFHSTNPQSEPWRSNVNGTRNVLDVCEATGIRDFHHVSTAYVCGLRQGVIREDEVNVGQELGNDYERSKLQAEEMIRGSEFLNSPTVYRPAIIVGDSETGFTTTFHGFYAALHLAHTLVKAHLSEESGKFVNDGRTRLTLDGDESKNLVPVDWVSAVIAHIITNPQHHGQTYHLTPREPVTTATVREVLVDTCGCYNAVFCGANAQLDDATEVEKLFYEHIHVYNSYWRDDPKFDCTNTLKAAPNLPCPHVDKEMLLRLSQAAIDIDFRWVDQPAPTTNQVL